MNRWAIYGLLLAAAFLLGGGSLNLSATAAIFGVWPATMIAGGILTVRGYVNGKRRGLSSERLLVTLCLAFASFFIFWVVLLAIIYAGPETSNLFGALLLVCWIPWLTLFSTGSMAYLALGPFRSRLSAMERTRRLIAVMPWLKVAAGDVIDHIAQAERILRLRFPASFREFLLVWGEIHTPTIRFLGITPTVDLSHPTPADCVGATLEAREKCGIPPHFILCAVDQRGQQVCLDTFAIRVNVAPAVLWDSNSRTVTRIIAPTFMDFLCEHLEAKASHHAL